MEGTGGVLEHMVRIRSDLDKLEMQKEKTEHKAEDMSAKHWHYYFFFPRQQGGQQYLGAKPTNPVNGNVIELAGLHHCRKGDPTGLYKFFGWPCPSWRRSREQ